MNANASAIALGAPLRRVALLLGICALACTSEADLTSTASAAQAAAGGGGLASTASVAPQVKLGVHLSPEHLGKGTTIEFSIQISAPGKLVPSPLSELDFRYPAKIGLLQSGLGRANCAAATLESLGKGGCPANALMGFGSALLEIQVGREVVREAGAMSIWMGPVADEELQLLFYASAATPASEQLVFGGLLEEAGLPFGGSLDTHIPPIPWNPEAPPASIADFTARIGPRNVTYYRRAGAREIPYRPEGLRLPHSCPLGGFPFAGSFTFIDGTTATARTSVPCPRRSA